jgi:hypothetical protein
MICRHWQVSHCVTVVAETAAQIAVSANVQKRRAAKATYFLSPFFFAFFSNRCRTIALKTATVAADDEDDFVAAGKCRTASPSPPRLLHRLQ